ncbi:DUF1704 domain-containing protein [Legionella pneumophila]|nr:DUF1704 domain-containing protein [Legionella pneumophila]
MSPSESGELSIIQELSQRIVEAQRQIRILDSIKWDESVKQEFFKFKGKKLPSIDKAYYDGKPLPFKVKDKQEEFRIILRDAQNQLGQYSTVTRLIRRQCEEYSRAAQMLSLRVPLHLAKWLWNCMVARTMCFMWVDRVCVKWVPCCLMY